MRRIPELALVLIVVAAIASGWLYATHVPKWNAPDEPAHFNYVRHIATTGTLPVLQVGDYDVQRVEERMAAQFPDRLPVDWMRYESHQPPLYYALATPVYLAVTNRAVGEQVVALRMFSTLLGALGLVLAYLLIREAFPKSRLLAVAVPGLMAFIPMRVAMYAAVENDALAEVALTAVLLALVYGLRRPIGRRYDLVVGALVAAALLTKMVDYIAVGLVPLAYLMAEVLPFGGKRTPIGEIAGRLVRRLAVVYGVAVLLSGWWFVRNVLTYGNLDVFGMKRHALIVVGQPLTIAPAREAIQHFVLTAFRSFWAQFGWMGIVVDERIYLFLTALCGVAALGLGLAVLRAIWRPAKVSPLTWEATLLLAVSALFVFVGVVFYNLTFLQPQGRYFFPALPALALFLALGLREVVAPRYAALLAGLLPVGLFGLTLLCLFRYVVPSFAG